MKHLKAIILIALMTVSGVSLSAQKFGHLNSRLLLMEMPEVKSADTEIEAFQKQLLAKGESMVTAFETKYKSYVTEANEGKLSALQMQEKESELRTEQQNIQKYEVEIQTKISEKQQQLYAPLLDKVKAAINKIGKEQGYTMIFDTSVAGAIVHAEQSEDVMNLVKQELGIQ